MKLARTGLIAAAILAVSTVAFAQKPDFSGTWTPDAPAAAPAAPAGGGQGGGARGGGMGGPMTVKQTATELTIERTMGENKTVATYKLDGTESVNKQMGRGGEIETKSTAKWDGSYRWFRSPNIIPLERYRSPDEWGRICAVLLRGQG